MLTHTREQRQSPATLIGLVLFAVAPALAQDPDPREIFAKADAATMAIRSISYTAHIWTEGAVSRRAQPMILKHRSVKQDAGVAPLVWIEYESTADAAQPFRVTVTNDGRRITRIDWLAHEVERGVVRDAGRLLDGPLYRFGLREFYSDSPFDDEVRADQVNYEGRTTINGVDCYVLYVVYERHGRPSRWYINVDTYLPQRVDRIYGFGDEPGQYTCELCDVQTDFTADPREFRISAPDGFVIREIEPGGAGNRREAPLLELGKSAPTWRLTTPAGALISLNDLNRRVVVLDFWCTWSEPCREWMPKLQALHEKYAEKGVLFYGVNAWEDKTADPIAFMQQAGFTYGLLLGGDEIAKLYRAPGFPAHYVIDGDGFVVYAAAGTDDAEAVDEAIQRALNNTQERFGPQQDQRTPPPIPQAESEPEL